MKDIIAISIYMCNVVLQEKIFKTLYRKEWTRVLEAGRHIDVSMCT